MKVATLADIKKIKKQVISMNINEDNNNHDDCYQPDTRPDNDDSTDEEKEIEELKDFEWEEEDIDGRIIIHKSGGPSEEEQVRSLRNDPRWSISHVRASIRFRRAVENASLNADEEDQVIDMSRTAGDGGARYKWVEDDEEGTHERVVIQRNGKEVVRFVPYRGTSNKRKSIQGQGGQKPGGLRSGKRRKTGNFEGEGHILGSN